MFARVMATSNIEVHLNTEVQEILGDGRAVNAVLVKNNISHEKETLK